MDRESRSGLMDPCMKASGTKIKPMEWEDSFIRMGMSMKENGLVIKLMGLVFTLTWMEQSTLDSGRKTSSTDKEKRVGQMVQCTKETISKERNKDKETSNGQMALYTLASSSTIILRALESTDGLMEEDKPQSFSVTK
jgi:hypothetical protein